MRPCSLETLWSGERSRMMGHCSSARPKTTSVSGVSQTFWVPPYEQLMRIADRVIRLMGCKEPLACSGNSSCPNPFRQPQRTRPLVRRIGWNLLLRLKFVKGNSRACEKHGEREHYG